MRRNASFWGAVLILVGLAFLLNTMGILNVAIWNLIWPILLIAFGVWILLGTVFRRPIKEEQVSIPLEAAERARIRFYHGAGRLFTSGKADPGLLMNGTFGGGLDYRTRRDGDLINVDLRVPESFFPWGWGPGEQLNWDFSLSDAIPLSLDFKTGASESQVDLSALRVTDLSLQTGASSTVITLPAAAGLTHARVESGAASVSLRVPSGVAARIRVNSGLAGINIDQTRFPRQADLYISNDYETSQNKVDIEIQTGVGAIDIR
jgi:hypothetical protein